NAAALLAAAAAVIVAGFGIGQVIDVGGPSGSDAAGSAAGSADREARQLESGGAGDNSAADSGGETSPSDNSANNAAPELPAPLVLSSDSLERDVSRQLKRSAAAPGVQAEADALAAYGCPAASAGKYGLGELFPALYDGEPAVLVLRPATGSTQRADVLACGTADELDSVTIPAP
ncbi:MAG TPA: hypothetical protein PK324_16865, partial [Nocardioides sp.]|nr:hypothetical protein [Nocardioides sp.]